jgi:tRNA U34 5-methylaminomethyl-2-thiouridine-forming methyltransferase MnmC
LKREIIITADGSTTIHIPEWDEQYHSKHGAIQEAYHVFIKSGLSLFENRNISILEIGFGTGLNTLITFFEAQKRTLNVNYIGVEAYPILQEELEKLNYSSELDFENCIEVFNKIHSLDWGNQHKVSDDFQLTKRQQFFDDIEDENRCDLIYFDAFGARIQPELWTESIFKKMYNALHYGGVLVTYSAKVSVRRAMISVGFVVERLEGPPGKREMLRAKKI